MGKGKTALAMTKKGPNDAGVVWALGTVSVFFPTFFLTNFIVYLGSKVRTTVVKREAATTKRAQMMHLASFWALGTSFFFTTSTKFHVL